MTASIGLYFVIFILAMIPFVFLGAGQDTTHRRAVRKQCRKDVLLDWTDKDALAAEHDLQTSAPAQRKKPITMTAAVEVITRDASGVYAA